MASNPKPSSTPYVSQFEDSRVSIRWKREIAFGNWVLSLLLAVAFYFQWMSPKYSWLEVILFAMIAVGVAYYAGVTLLNKTVLTFDGAELRAHHGPLPWLRRTQQILRGNITSVGINQEWRARRKFLSGVQTYRIFKIFLSNSVHLDLPIEDQESALKIAEWIIRKIGLKAPEITIKNQHSARGTKSTFSFDPIYSIVLSATCVFIIISTFKWYFMDLKTVSPKFYEFLFGEISVGRIDEVSFFKGALLVALPFMLIWVNCYLWSKVLSSLWFIKNEKTENEQVEEPARMLPCAGCGGTISEWDSICPSCGKIRLVTEESERLKRIACIAFGAVLGSACLALLYV